MIPRVIIIIMELSSVDEVGRKSKVPVRMQRKEVTVDHLTTEATGDDLA